VNKEQQEALSVVNVLIRVPNAFLLVGLLCFGPIIGVVTLFNTGYTVPFRLFVALAVATLAAISVLIQKKVDHIAARTLINLLLFKCLDLLSNYLEDI
jgi:hypothetical protein